MARVQLAMMLYNAIQPIPDRLQARIVVALRLLSFRMRVSLHVIACTATVFGHEQKIRRADCNIAGMPNARNVLAMSCSHDSAIIAVMPFT